jgi:hypothetical protein
MRMLLAVLFAAAAGLAAAGDDTWIRTSDVGLNPVRRDTHETLKLAPNAGIEVERIGGSVQVTGADVDTVTLDYRRSAATQADFDCETLRFDNGATLHISVEPVRRGECHSIRANDELRLLVPRAAAIALNQIGDSVHVSGVTGMVELESIGDSASLDGVTQLRAGSIGDTLRIDTGTLAPAGMRIDSVGDRVELHLAANLGARLSIDSVGGEVRGAGVDFVREDGATNVTLGAGGPDIRISSVGDDVVISR